MSHNNASIDTVRATGLKQYAAEHGWDYELLADWLEKSVYDKRYSLKAMCPVFLKRNGRQYSDRWFAILRKVYLEEKGQA